MAWGELQDAVEREAEAAAAAATTTTTTASASEPGRTHAVCLPFPAYSHVVQIRHFARHLVRHHGFRVTLITSTHYYNELVKSNGLGGDNIKFLHVSDGLPEDHPRLAGNLMHYVKAVYGMEPALNAVLASLDGHSPIACLIRDLHLPFQFAAVRAVGTAIASFAPNSAHKEYLNRSIGSLISIKVLPDPEEGVMPIDYDRALTDLEGVSPELRVGDLPVWPSVKGPLHPAVVASIENRVRQYVLSDWVIFNTVYEVEAATVDALRRLTPNVCTAGPLDVAEPEQSSMHHWLADRDPASVLLVAFGTTTARSVDQFKEFALGLEASDQSFLWVFSPEQVGGEQSGFLDFMAGFQTRTKKRGFVTKWIPDFLATLRHPSIGAFLSHCGWHSVLEGLTSAVPFLTWPFQYDHWPIARCVTHVWKVGFSLEGEGGSTVVARAEVERQVRRVLARGAEMDAVRARCKALQEVSERAVLEGGSSQRSVAEFVAHVRKAHVKQNQIHNQYQAPFLVSESMVTVQ